MHHNNNSLQLISCKTLLFVGKNWVYTVHILLSHFGEKKKKKKEEREKRKGKKKKRMWTLVRVPHRAASNKHYTLCLELK